jgi:hypothetical protein
MASGENSADVTASAGADQGAPNDSRTNVADWSSHLAQISGVAASIIFGAFYLALRLFYGSLGVSPEEVGWDLQSVVLHFAPVFLLVLLIVWGIRTRAHSRSTGSPNESDARRQTRWTTLATSAFIACAVAAFAAIGWATMFANDVKRGVALSASIDRMFPVTAQCVTVNWLDSDVAPAAADGLRDEHPVLYLGRAGGIAVFYDFDADIPIRVPAGLVLISGC